MSNIITFPSTKGIRRVDTDSLYEIIQPAIREKLIELEVYDLCIKTNNGNRLLGGLLTEAAIKAIKEG